MMFGPGGDGSLGALSRWKRDPLVAGDGYCKCDLCRKAWGLKFKGQATHRFPQNTGQATTSSWRLDSDRNKLRRWCCGRARSSRSARALKSSPDSRDMQLTDSHEIGTRRLRAAGDSTQIETSSAGGAAAEHGAPEDVPSTTLRARFSLGSRPFWPIFGRVES